MLIASRNGTISAATLISETQKVWTLELDGESRTVRISKSDKHQRAFDLMSDALRWANSDQEMIQHFVDQEEAELAKSIDLPEATLWQLGVVDSAFELSFKPLYCAMDGCGQPGGAWYLFEDRPTFNTTTRFWDTDGYGWQIAKDVTDDLSETPAFQRWVKPALSLMRIVVVTTGQPQYHPLAYMPESSRKTVHEAPAEHPYDAYARTKREAEAAETACIAFVEFWLPARLRKAFQTPEEVEALNYVARGYDVHLCPEIWKLSDPVRLAAKRVNLFFASNKRFRGLVDTYTHARFHADNAEWEVEELEEQKKQDYADTYAHIEAELVSGWKEECRDLGLI